MMGSQSFALLSKEDDLSTWEKAVVGYVWIMLDIVGYIWLANGIAGAREEN